MYISADQGTEDIDDRHGGCKINEDPNLNDRTLALPTVFTRDSTHRLIDSFEQIIFWPTVLVACSYLFTGLGHVDARAPTVPEADANGQPRPKVSYSRQFDRRPFIGRQKEGPKQSFLDEHGLCSDSLPVEYADAFFPMYENKVKDEHGDPMMSMEAFTRNLNMRACWLKRHRGHRQCWITPRST